MSKKATRRKRWRTVFLVLLALLGIGVATTGYLYYVYIVLHPGEHLSRADILRRISRESPVYYRDGKHKIGVFFGAEHRQYVTYEELPKAFVQAIVSAEDKNFFHHHGVDPRGIARAMIANIKAGRIVAGGSTITQQTAKNLYYRNERTWRAKWTELINALRLEAHYSKEEILEFYVNQFHVHANGRGLGIAARYFFDKDVKDLTVLECAFLAGVVKGPFRYNPFVGKTEEQRERARARARLRTHYVIDRMVANGYLTQAEAEKLKAQKLQFKKGEFRYAQSVILDYVFDRIQDDRFKQLLAEHGIENPAVAGIRVYTTIDREFQTAALYGLRHHLTELAGPLEGVDLSAFFAETRPILPINPDDVVQYGFYDGRVKSKQLEGEHGPSLEVDVGGVSCTVDQVGMQRVADILARAKKKNKWSRASRSYRKEVARRIPDGQNVWVSIRRIQPDGVYLCDLETRPELQGAVVVLDRGRLRAMVGGQDNRNFNRATSALRQFGSTFKPLTYTAARTLGWGTLSPLDNRRQGFYFQRQWYWPRPDHKGVTPYVSMAQAGATSENVASVSLLYHLTDKLDDDQLKDLAHRVGMAPEVGESTTDYAKRIRDVYGVVPDKESWTEGLFEQAKRNLSVELAFSNRAREVRDLEHLVYGRGFDKELAATKHVRKADERRARRAFLDRGFLQIEALAPKALADAQTLLDSMPVPIPAAGLRGTLQGVFRRTMQRLGRGAEEASALAPNVSEDELNKALEHFYLRQGAEGPRLIYARFQHEGWTKPTRGQVLEILTGRPVHLEPGNDTSSEGTADPNASGGSGGAVDAGTREGAPSGREQETGGARSGTAGRSTGAQAPPADGTDDVSGHGLLGLEDRLFPEKLNAPPPDPAEVILLEDTVSPATVRDLREVLDERLAETDPPAKYDLDRLIHNREFRVMLGLQYVMHLARTMGVESKLRPVLSLTLGANEITLLEAALMYQTLLEGDVYSFDGIGPDAAIIERIEDADGATIYQLDERRQQVLDPSIGPSIGRILRQVVLAGTGSRARDAVRVASPDLEVDARLERARYLVPLFGKTGTTNSYANAAFVGFVPAPRSRGAEIPYGQALTVGTYVGYDDNRPMKRGSIRVHGSSGALPAWILAAQGIVRDLDLAQLLDLSALNPGDVVPIAWPRDMAAVAIDASTGLRTGIGVVVPDEPIPEGSVPFEVYGFADGSGWREREAYLPFLRWGEKPATGFVASPGPIREYPLGSEGRQDGSTRAAAPGSMDAR